MAAEENNTFLFSTVWSQQLTKHPTETNVSPAMQFAACHSTPESLVSAAGFYGAPRRGACLPWKNIPNPNRTWIVFTPGFGTVRPAFEICM